MTEKLLKKRIIFVHGLASKPPQKDLHELCVRSLIANIGVIDQTLAKALKEDPSIFVSAYWANATPHHLEDQPRYVAKLRTQVDKVIKERKKIKDKFHVKPGAHVKNFFKSKGIHLFDLLSSALTFKDEAFEKLMREIELYHKDQYIADQMRKPLEDALRQAWDDDCEVAVIAHSMGTFISYDVLWRFSMRNVPGFREYRKKRVRIFSTIGSPLGDSAVKDLLLLRYLKKTEKRRYPANIDFWHNYACLGDVVSFDNQLEDDFFVPMRKEGLFPATTRKRYHAIDYYNLYNPFEVVSHKGNKKRVKNDPHSLYGYLIQPRLGTWMSDFLKERLK